MGNVVVAPPNQAAIVSGPRGTRIVVGGCAFRMWFLESCKNLSLQMMTLEVSPTHTHTHTHIFASAQVQSHEAETVRGVRVTVTGVCQIKVHAFNDENGELAHASIKLAAQHFLGNRDDHIQHSILRTMEGHQRQILGTLTVEELYKDRAAFSERVREHVFEDLSAMGFKLVSYTVTSIRDSGGYMEALGATQTALVKREAAEGTAKNESEARKKTELFKSEADIAAANARREAHVNVNEQKQAEAQADRDLNIKRAVYEKEINTAKAEAEAAYSIEKAKQEQSVVRETTQQQVEQSQVMVQVAEREATRVQKEKEGQSLAVLIEQKNKAEAIRVLAEAEADKIQRVGDAEASATRAKGEAEAEVLRKKADAYKEYGEAAIVQSIVEQLPAIAEAVSKPLQQTEKMVFISGDGSSGSRLSKDIIKMMAEVPDAVGALTGVDVKQVIKQVSEGQGRKPVQAM